MKILLVAPEICEPWTEGRKRFVRELAEAFSVQHEVRLLTTQLVGQGSIDSVSVDAATCGWGPWHLLSLHRRLPGLLAQFHPDLVFHLPYGTFNGLHLPANLWTMNTIDRQCRTVGTPCFTVMYSIIGRISVQRLGRWVKHFVTQPGVANWPTCARFGMQLDTHPGITQQRLPAEQPVLLFMAGMWQASAERLQYVLERRGLDTLLMAGQVLAPKGYRLLLASPIFEHAELRDKLLTADNNSWPAEQIDFAGTVSPADAHARADLFIFPYTVQETQFVPTSVIEAMLNGLPVVLPDLEFLRPLSQGGKVTGSYAAGDPLALATEVENICTDHDRYQSLRLGARKFAETQMSIEGTVADLLSLYRQAGNEEG